MTMDVLIGEARERLLVRAKREGLATIGYDVLASPLGPLWVAIGPKGVTTIHYGDEPSESELRRLVRVYGPGVVPDHKRPGALARELDEYFRGRRHEFDIDVDLSGLTPFQTRVLSATAKTPFGDVRTYGAVAKRARCTGARGIPARGWLVGAASGAGRSCGAARSRGCSCAASRRAGWHGWACRPLWRRRRAARYWPARVAPPERELRPALSQPRA